MIECEHIPQVKSENPTVSMTEPFPHLREIASEIPPIDHDVNVELLIGRDTPEVLKVKQFKNGPRGAPWAQKHIIGWTISGEMCLDRIGGPVHISPRRTSVDPPLVPLSPNKPANDRVEYQIVSETVPYPNYFNVKNSMVRTLPLTNRRVISTVQLPMTMRQACSGKIVDSLKLWRRAPIRMRWEIGKCHCPSGHPK